MISTKKRKKPDRLAQILKRLDKIEKILSRSLVPEVEVYSGSNEFKQHYSPYHTTPAVDDEPISDKNENYLEKERREKEEQRFKKTDKGYEYRARD